MRKGCVLAAALLVILIAVGGYLGYTMIRERFGIPEDLAPYADSLATLVRSDAAAPPDTAHLTPERVELFIGAFDSVNTGWYTMLHTFDSLGIRNDQGKQIDIWKSPAIIQEAIKLPFLMRRGLVSYLNARNLSLAEYAWLKERTVAASGITHQEVATVLLDSLSRYMRVRDSSVINSGERLATFFRRIDQIRESGAIDSSDIALVSPYRQIILRRGLVTFLSLELDEDQDVLFLNIK